MQPHPTDSLDDGDLPTPRRLIPLNLSDDDFVALLSGRRTQIALYAGDVTPQVDVADLLILGETGSARRSFMAMVTDVWTSDGIAPGWVIASLRAVLLAPVRLVDDGPFLRDIAHRIAGT